MNHIIFFVIFSFVSGAITGATDSSTITNSGEDDKSKSNLVENFLKNRKKGGKHTSDQDKVKSRSGGGNMIHGHGGSLPQHQGMVQHGRGGNLPQHQVLVQHGHGGNIPQGQGAILPQQPLGGNMQPGQIKGGQVNPVTQTFNQGAYRGLNRPQPAKQLSPAKTTFTQPSSYGNQPQRQPRPASSYSSSFPSSYKSSFSPSSSSYNFGGNSFSFDKNKAGAKNTQMCNIGGRKLFVGDTWSITGICALFTCRENHFRTVTSVCPALKYQESYKCEVLMQDLNLDYPQCCPRLSCSTADSHPAQRKDNNNNNNMGSFSSIFNRSPKQQI